MKVSGIKIVKALENVVEVTFNDKKAIAFEDCWLRDHCRCPSCYHADTFQRAQHILDIPETKVVDVTFTEAELSLTWDDGHESKYKADFLIKFDYESFVGGQRLKPVLWHGGAVAANVPHIPVTEFLDSVDGARKVFQSLLDHGVALIEEVEPTLQATEKVCQALGGVQNTIFGGMWQFTTEAVHADTAYTNLPLAPHNDNTYFTEAAGLQILHCIEHSDGTGGETVLVDGFFGAKRLQEQFPEDYEFLSNFNVEAEYIEKGHHHKYSAPVINVDSKTKDLKQIRFNVYDRAPMAFANKEECRSYYRSLRNLARFYQDPDNQWKFKLKPGIVMVMDNFRVLHGRTGFSGKRVLCGSYVARSDWLDKARASNLIQ